MKEEVLNQIKDSYNQKKKIRNDILALLDRLRKLEENDIVKEYIKLKQQLDTTNYQKILGEPENQILYSTFYSHRYMIKDTNEIYVCIGTFRLDNICDIEHGPSDIRLKRDDPRAEYRIYRNLEDEFSKQIPIHKCEEFERTHNVIIPKTTLSTEKYYYELQKEFITLAVTEGQETACRKILKRAK